ncbi:MAG: PDZ domain-containing protein, partial [Planctomycetota bacterium]|nr:PDZ domain-containing protein [Planctomycetota bacterium]
IRENGYVDRSFLGVMPSLIPGDLVSQYQIPDGLGAFVQSVTRATAAERAGIREGDIILSWNGQVVENDIILFRLVGLTPPNSIAAVELLRGGRKIRVEVKVDSRNQWVTP